MSEKKDTKPKYGYVYRAMPRRNNAKQQERGWWSDAVKVKAVTLWLETGSLPVVSHTLDIPYNTVRDWRTKPWWREIQAHVENEGDSELDAKYTKLVQKSLAAIEDRLEKGDFQYDPKTGKMIRKPVLMRDALRVTNDLMDKRNIIRKNEKRESSLQTVEDRLKKLADNFSEFTKARTVQIPADVIDVDPIEKEET